MALMQYLTSQQKYYCHILNKKWNPVQTEPAASSSHYSYRDFQLLWLLHSLSMTTNIYEGKTKALPHIHSPVSSRQEFPPTQAERLSKSCSHTDCGSFPSTLVGKLKGSNVNEAYTMKAEIQCSLKQAKSSSDLSKSHMQNI